MLRACVGTPIERRSIMRDQRVCIERFAYRDVHRRKGECRIEALALPDGRVAVIATELPDNPGMSITNAAEHAATAVCKHLGIDPQRLAWIEHYPQEPCPACRGRGKRDRRSCRVCDGRGVRRESPTYDRVEFNAITPGAELFFGEPDWFPMTERDWRDLGLEPRA
jgi:hypothetical protein